MFTESVGQAFSGHTGDSLFLPHAVWSLSWKTGTAGDGSIRVLGPSHIWEQWTLSP